MLLFIDGFDHYQTPQITRKWTAVSGFPGPVVVAGGGRNGTQGLSLAGGYVLKGVPGVPSSTLICGFALNLTSIPTAPQTTLLSIVVIDNSQTRYNFNVILNPDGTLSAGYATNGQPSAPLGRSTVSLSQGVWNYIEFKMPFLTGSSEIRINGAVQVYGPIPPIASYPSMAVQLGPFPGVVDDFYMVGSPGGNVSNYLGDVAVQAIYPNGAGDSTQFSSSGGSNYACVNEPLVDDDATFVYSATPGNVDLYDVASLPLSPTAIFGVQWNGQVRKADASSYIFLAAMAPGGVATFDPTLFSASGSYANYASVWELNPVTTLPWTASDFASLQAGIRLNSRV